MEDSEDDADSNGIIVPLIVVFVLTLINAVFAAAELAVISANKTKINVLIEKGNKKAKLVQKLSENQTNFLSTIQVWITLAGFFSSATAASSLSEDLGIWFESINIPFGETVALVLITLILSLFMLIFGELFPKRIALQYPEKVAMGLAKFINLMKIIAIPFVKFLSFACNLLVKITGLNKKSEDDKVTKEEIKNVVEESVNSGTLDEGTQDMIEGILKINTLKANDIMTPRVDVYMIDVNREFKSLIDEILELNYTRIPVYNNYRDNIIGILNLKDLTTELVNNTIENINIEKLLRPIFVVSSHLNVYKLFKLMKINKTQIALLYDEYGGFEGIVTMEDIIEEVVGDILDEYDYDELNFIKKSPNEYLINGNTPIQDVNRHLDLNLDENNVFYDTIAGLVIAKLDRIPNENEVIEIDLDNCVIITEKVLKNRIIRVRLVIKEKEEI